MKNYRKYLKLVLLIIFPIVFFLSVVVLFWNQGLRFSEFGNRVEVQFSGEGNLNEVLDSIKQSGSSNLAFLDYENFTAGFQYISLSQAEEIALANIQEGVDFNVSELIPNKGLYLIHYLLVSVVMLATAVLTSFYFFFRNNSRLKFRDFSKVYGGLIIVYALSSVIYLGVLSLISRFTYIKEIEFNIVYFLNLITVLLFVSAIYRFKDKERIGTQELLNDLVENQTRFFIPTVIVLLAAVVPMTYALGLKVLPAELYFTASLAILALSTLFVKLFAKILAKKTLKQRIKEGRNKLKRRKVKSNKESVKEESKSAEMSKKASKPQKKKKKKDKKKAQKKRS